MTTKNKTLLLVEDNELVSSKQAATGIDCALTLGRGMRQGSSFTWFFDIKAFLAGVQPAKGDAHE